MFNSKIPYLINVLEVVYPLTGNGVSMLWLSIDIDILRRICHSHDLQIGFIFQVRFVISEQIKQESLSSGLL